MKDSKNVLKILKSNSVTFESAPPLELVGLGLETWSAHEFVLLFWGLILSTHVGWLAPPSYSSSKRSMPSSDHHRHLHTYCPYPHSHIYAQFKFFFNCRKPNPILCHCNNVIVHRASGKLYSAHERKQVPKASVWWWNSFSLLTSREALGAPRVPGLH